MGKGSKRGVHVSQRYSRNTIYCCLLKLSQIMKGMPTITSQTSSSFSWPYHVATILFQRAILQRSHTVAHTVFAAIRLDTSTSLIYERSFSLLISIHPTANPDCKIHRANAVACNGFQRNACVCRCLF